MQLRELQSKNVFIYGDNSHAHKYVSLWTLLALQSNVAQYGQDYYCSTAKEIGVSPGCYQLTSMLTTIVDGDVTENELSAFNSMHSPGVNLVNAYVLSARSPSLHPLSFDLGDLLANFQSGIWFNATAPLDGLVFSARITSELSYAFISDLITPYLLIRDAFSPPFALFFHKLQDNEKYMVPFNHNATRRSRGRRRSLGAQNRVTLLHNNSRHLSAEDGTSQDDKGKDLDTIGTSSNREQGNAMLGWLTMAKEMYSVDNHIFGSTALKTLGDVRKEKIRTSAENFCHDEDKIRSIEFVYSSLLATPRATLVHTPRLQLSRYQQLQVLTVHMFMFPRQITPCSRPQLLQEVLKSLRFGFIQEWIIVHDHMKVNESVAVFQGKHPKIREVFNTISGSFGNSERDFGLSLVPPERKGFIYFLDDDNYVHVNLWTLMQQLPLQNIVFTGQIQGCPNDDQSAWFPTKCQVYWVDTGVGFFSRELLIGIHWDPVRHEADGLFYQSVCKAYPDKITRTQLVASYHNGQYCKEVAVELKNDKPLQQVVLIGTLISVDQYLNVKLKAIRVADEKAHPQLGCMKNCFIRGSAVRYIQIPASEVDTELLQDAARKENTAR
eukprot:gene22540-30805_t